MLSLSRLQKELKEWRLRNFPSSGNTTDQFLGVVEEVGELAHAMLKERQGIRGYSHEMEAYDAIGDIAIYLINCAEEFGWSFEEILQQTWMQVRERDWITYPKDGRSE